MAVAPPSLRELELETLLRERDSQLTELTDEISFLRRYLTEQPQPSYSDPLLLPPALLSVLQSYVGQSSKDGAGSSSGTMTAALIQRSRTVQDENDELYGLLQSSRTGQLKEEVRNLKGTVSHLTRALTDAHLTIKTLSEEVNKSYSSFLAQQETAARSQIRRESRSRSPPLRRQAQLSSNNVDAKNVPTEPRAHKKPRLNDSQVSPSSSPASVARSMPTGPAGGGWKRSGRRERSPRGGDGRISPSKERRIDGEDIKHVRDNSPERLRERETRDRGRERPREREKNERPRDAKPKEKDEKRRDDRDNEHSRRNGRGSGGGGSGGGRKVGRGSAAQDDRTLRQRMGL